jgi:predicted nucleotidyltransferase
MHEHSDIDLLVVVPSGVHRRRTAQKIYRNLIGVGFAADIVVVTEDDVERYGETEGIIIDRCSEKER